MTDRAMRFRLGLFVLAALVLLGVLAVWFGSVPGLFKSRHGYTVTFADAPGLGPGSPVRRAGVRIGEGRSVEPAHSLREAVPGLRRPNEEIHASAQNGSKLGSHLDALLTENHDKLVRAVDRLNDVLTRVGGVFNEDNERNLAALLQNVKTGTEGL